MPKSSNRSSRTLIILGGVLSALGGIEVVLGSPAVDWLPILWFGITCGFVGGWVQFVDRTDMQSPIGTVFGWVTAIGGMLLIGFAVVLAIGFERVTIRIAGLGGIGIATIVFVLGHAVRERFIG